MIEISTNKSKFQIGVIHSFLTNHIGQKEVLLMIYI